MWKVAILAVLACGFCVAPSWSSPPKVSVRDRWLVDDLGRVRIYHGLNSVEKNFPWYPDGHGAQLNFMNSTVLDLLHGWGFNAVRLGTMWAGAEPAQGQFNQTYLDIISSILRQLDQRGISAILDMHQDVISSAFGSYDGVPRWLIDSLTPSKHPYPWPFKKLHGWAQGYLTQAVGKAFQDIYDNENDAHALFAAFWKMMAQTFNSTAHPNVLGYELINEPWAGDIYSDPSLLLPGEAGKRNLLPLYDAANAAIRSVQPDALIFYEPVTWSVMRNGKYIGTGLDRVPGGDAFRNRSVLSFHYYCWYITGAMGPHNETKLLRRLCDDKLGPNVFKAIDEDLGQTGGASFLTEFGMSKPDSNPYSMSTVESNVVMDLADKHFQSWTYWDSTLIDGTGNIVWPAVKALSRPYARAISGIPISMTFDVQSCRFQLQYNQSTSISAPTDVFIPSLHYPKGISVDLSPGFAWSYNTTAHILSITASKENWRDAVVKLTVTPKA